MHKVAITIPLNVSPANTINAAQFAREPFRLFFPLAVLAGIAGVALWPLHLLGVLDMYPGQVHARIMTYGLFGGFIFGFLGTAMPRMLSARPLRLAELAPLAALYLAMVGLFTIGNQRLGDLLSALLLLCFASLMLARLPSRKDTPPPGFLLVGLSFLCAIAGSSLAVAQNHYEVSAFWASFQRLLSYQGFVLLPILGIGPFILPRFFGLQSSHDFPETLAPAASWKRKAAHAFTVGFIVIGTFAVEAAGWFKTAYAIRFAVVLAYFLIEMPFHRAPNARNALGFSIRAGFLSIVAGFLAIAFFPEYRVGLLHLTLVGGFAIITFVVATRVVFGHSGNIHLLKKSNRWLLVTVGLMLLGMATRISGDIWPKVMASHYIYGAILWIASISVWAIYVLPKVLIVEKE